MDTNNHHRLVNWEEGMDVRFGNLRQLEDYFIDRLCDSQAMRLTSYTFGLLPMIGTQGDSTEFDISERVTGKVEIRLRRCNALTRGGCRISYNPPQGDYLHHVHNFEESRQEKSQSSSGGTRFWDVILSVDPYKRIPTGIPHIEETPPRHPDAMENYRLSVTAQGEINKEQLGQFYLVIGRIRQSTTGRYEVDTNYIPPCVSVNSHSDLLRYYEHFGIYLNDIERASKIIISKVRNREKNYPIAENICKICEDMMRYIASIYFPYRNIGRELSPVELVNYFSTLAHTTYISINFIGKHEKEEMLKYFYEWSDVTPGSFEELLSDTLSLIYDHNSIRGMMLRIESFLRLMSELWLKLSSLEYIGQHKDNIIVSERRQQVESPKNKGGWTILD